MSVESMNDIQNNKKSCNEGMPPVVGILGGIGSGKSTIARWVTSRNSVCLIDGDQVGHEVLLLEPIKQAIRERFGDSVFDSEQQEVDRTALGNLVFGTSVKSRESLADLETIVHPVIREQFNIKITEAKKSGLCEVIVLDAAVLLESEWDVFCDATVFIDTPREDRLQRVTQQRNWDETELTKREACQIPVSDKRKRADYIIQNDTTLEDAGEQFQAILKECKFKGTDS